jgi:hypothetical protein
MRKLSIADYEMTGTVMKLKAFISDVQTYSKRLFRSDENEVVKHLDFIF